VTKRDELLAEISSARSSIAQIGIVIANLNRMAEDGRLRPDVVVPLDSIARSAGELTSTLGRMEQLLSTITATE
jgi:hypothetical protein